ncbi:MAG: serine/threonine protein kinase [Archangiaceae bacterium]|nr:serine/threonine protein kinase [Archangiaceae bacterium]
MAEQRFGKYTLVKLLASGGMGEIFLARQEGPQGFQKPVVIKRILKHLAEEPTFREMFLNEGRLAALLMHPNVTQIFDLGMEQGAYFLAMEFVRGHTLRAVSSRLKKAGREFPPAYAARITAAALHGLHHAHTLKGENGEPLGIVHRDVSPDNVMVGFDGSVKVLDFGVAKAAALAGSTLTGMVKGKHAYMSPEQLDGAAVDARTDVWAAGVMLYELVAGRRPFPAEEDRVLAKQIASQEPPPLETLAPDAAALAPIAHRALEKNAARRFPTAELMATALERYCTAAQVSLTNAETATFMRQLFGDEANPSGGHPAVSAKAPLAEAPEAPSGLYLSAINPIHPTKMSQVFSGVKRLRWRALGVGIAAAICMLSIGFGLAMLGARRTEITAPRSTPSPRCPSLIHRHRSTRRPSTPARRCPAKNRPRPPSPRRLQRYAARAARSTCASSRGPRSSKAAAATG